MQKLMSEQEFNLKVNPQNALCISGSIYLSNVKLACMQGRELIDTLSAVNVDLSGLQFSDSSILAMLVDWIRSAKEQNKDIMFSNMPKFLLDLGRVCGLDAILPISKPLQFHQ